MEYYEEYHNYLADSLSFMEKRVNLGYKFPALFDDVIDLTETGYQTIQKQKILFYRFTQEFKEELLELPSAQKIAELLIENQDFISSLNRGKPDGINENVFLKMWVPDIYILGFLNKYLEQFKYSQTMDFKVNEELFLKVLSDLEIYVTRPKNNFQVLIPLWNFTLETNSILLSSNIYLRKLTDDERKYIIKNHFGTNPMFSDCPLYGIEIIYNNKEVSQEDFSSLVEKLIFVLRLLKPSMVYASRELSRVYPHTLWDSDYAASWNHTFTPVGKGLNISLEDIPSLQELWNSINNHLVLKHKILNRIKNRFNNLHLSSDTTDKIVDSVIILESLFLDDANSELSYRLSLRIAVFMGTEFESRKFLKEFVRKLYSLRSKLVHGSEISKKDMIVNGRQLSLDELGNQAEKLVRECIKKIIHEIKTTNHFHSKQCDDMLLM